MAEVDGKAGRASGSLEDCELTRDESQSHLLLDITENLVRSWTVVQCKELYKIWFFEVAQQWCGEPFDVHVIHSNDLTRYFEIGSFTQNPHKVGFLDSAHNVLKSFVHGLAKTVEEAVQVKGKPSLFTHSIKDWQLMDNSGCFPASYGSFHKQTLMQPNYDQKSTVNSFICSRSAPGSFMYVSPPFKQNRYFLNLTLKTNCRLAVEVRHQENRTVLIQQELGLDCQLQLNIIDRSQVTKPSSLGHSCNLCENYVFPEIFAPQACHVSSIVNNNGKMPVICHCLKWLNEYTKEGDKCFEGELVIQSNVMWSNLTAPTEYNIYPFDVCANIRKMEVAQRIGYVSSLEKDASRTVATVESLVLSLHILNHDQNLSFEYASIRFDLSRLDAEGAPEPQRMLSTSKKEYLNL
uniref:Uncharacterized protein n=1 Tax=Romanomermis culicivorax TaxID=13658 RepID=A0A915KWQ6_ROMCU